MPTKPKVSMPRPALSRRVVLYDLGSDERAALKEQASAAGRTISRYGSDLLRKGLKRRPVGA